MAVLDNRIRILSRILLSSFSDSRCFSVFELDPFSVEETEWQKEQFRLLHSELSSDSCLERMRSCLSIASVDESLLLFFSGSTYCGQSSLASLIISAISWVELFTAGTKEFNIEVYRTSFSFDLSALAMLQSSLQLVEGERPIIDCFTCGTCNICKA